MPLFDKYRWVGLDWAGLGWAGLGWAGLQVKDKILNLKFVVRRKRAKLTPPQVGEESP